MNEVELVVITLCSAVFSALLLAPVFIWQIRKLRVANIARRKAVVDQLAVDKVAPQTFVGFFHPYCNAGGGGERVLWAAIKYLQQTERGLVCVVYTGDTDASKTDILNKVNSRFNITLDASSLHFVFLNSRKYVEAKTWPRFTLAGQSIGSMYLAWEAMSILIPDIFIDTMGYAFTFHVVRLLGAIPVAAYTHYPSISSDMLERVRTRKAWHTNTGAIASSSVLSFAKLLYYRIFAFFYSHALGKASFLMVNSTWTKNHVDAILAQTKGTLGAFALRVIDPTSGHTQRVSTRTVYPPCDTGIMARMPLEGRERVILSVAQFRPEKDLLMQLRALAALFDKRPDWRAGPLRVELVLLGGARDADDVARVESLRALAAALGIADNVTFIVNADFPALLVQLERASIGISTMVDEHFGINVVEYMAAGLIPVVNASGGPLLDIVVPVDDQPTGFHATDAASYAQALADALSLTSEADLAMRRRARAHAVKAFSTREFQKGWAAGGWDAWRAAVRAEQEVVRARARARADAETAKKAVDHKVL